MDIKRIIKEKGWTIDKVSKEMGINRVTLSQTITRNPTVKTLQRIADVIGCKVSDFFKDELEEKETTCAVPTTQIRCPHCGKPISINLCVNNQKEGD